MPLHASVLGAAAGDLTVEVDHRWTMAYAAGVPDTSPELYDTAGGLAVHPLFPVAVEWQSIMAQRSEGTGLTSAEVRRGIHVDHDLALDGPIPAHGRVRLHATTVAVGRRRAGATQTVLFTATDADGTRLWRTLNTSLFLGVDLVGEPAEMALDWPDTPTLAAAPSATESATAGIQSFVRPVDAHVYSECARIWNPIHTDVVAARAAGLERPILHGTATLARAVSLATRQIGAPLVDVRRIAGRFSAPVDLDSTIEVEVTDTGARSLAFTVRAGTGSVAVRDGLICW